MNSEALKELQKVNGEIEDAVYANNSELNRIAGLQRSITDARDEIKRRERFIDRRETKAKQLAQQI